MVGLISFSQEFLATHVGTLNGRFGQEVPDLRTNTGATFVYEVYLCTSDTDEKLWVMSSNH